MLNMYCVYHTINRHKDIDIKILENELNIPKSNFSNATCINAKK